MTSPDQVLHWVRRRQSALAKGVLALFCLAWLQTAVLPCAMADTGAATMPASGQHCPYCPQDGSASPATNHLGACSYPHQPQVDARTAGGLFIAIPVSSLPPLPDGAGRDLHAPAVSLPDPIPRIPIPLSFCRFLE
jgi:hypothetical protein